MKPMVYTEERKKRAEILHKAEYKGHKVLILSFGTHPCAYIEDKFKSNSAWHDYVKYALEVNGGVNYFGDRKIVTGDETCYFGWDYHHSWDYSGCAEIRNCCIGESLNKHTTEEIWEDCKRAIDQLIEMEKEVYEK